MPPAARRACVDDLTWHNLDMDDVFRRLDACQSEAGDVRLYSVLRTPGAPAAELEARAALCEQLDADAALRLDIQYILSRMGRQNTGTIQTLALDASVLQVRYKTLIRILAVLPLGCFFVLFASPAAGLVLLAASLVFNFISCYIFKNNTSSFNVVFPLGTAAACAKKLLPRLESMDARRAAALREKLSSLRSFGVPLFIMQHSNLLTEGMLLPDFWGIFQLPMLCYFWVVKRLAAKSGEIAAFYAELGELDVACSILSYRTGLPLWAKPAFCTETKLVAQDVYHPLLAAPVPNSIEVSRSVLLTGSNASGKSTFLKALAVNCLLAQTMDTCCAGAFTLRRGGVVSAMAISDNITEGESYFVAEVKALRRMLQMLEGEGFFYLFIDEILRGTNTVERIGASSSFLRYVAGRNCICLAATHDMELVSLSAGQYDQYHFSERIEGSAVLFDYRLQDGPVTSRNALKLLEVYAFPPEVLKDAQEAVAGFEETGRWKI